MRIGAGAAVSALVLLQVLSRAVTFALNLVLAENEPLSYLIQK